MLRNMFDRHRARYESQPIQTSPSNEDGRGSHGDLVEDALSSMEEGQSRTSAGTETVTTTSSTTLNATTTANTSNIILTATTPQRPNQSAVALRPVDENDDTEEGDDDEEERNNTEFTSHQFTLAELEEEREIARRRSSACVMFSVFILFRLWMEAIQTGDFGLLMLSLLGTSWTARWIRHNREQEEELDRRIANYYLEQQNGGSTTTFDRNDLRMLSFQAQLALAIMESQRQMMQGGGYGHHDHNANPGVTAETKASWNRFNFKKPRSTQYGSVKQHEDDDVETAKVKKVTDDEEPHCSICLCEYEDNEELVKLPCTHVYHDECIKSWTSNHTKCPLCNYELEQPLQS